jgi:glucose-6-phosphate isomerase
VLDATDPAQVKAFENRGRSANTLFIVSSKWGTTLNVFQQYFFELTVSRRVGAKEAGTAVASSIFGIHSFDQPDVEVSKIATRRLTDASEKKRSSASRGTHFHRVASRRVIAGDL